MKKLILGACALSCAVSVFAQGTVILNNYLPGTAVSKIYGPNAGTDIAAEKHGNAANQLPAGATDWTGYTGLSGAGWTVQIWSAPGSAQPESSLAPATVTTTMRTLAAAAGYVNPLTITLANVPADAAVATLQLRAWDNAGGTINTWAAALAAGPNELVGKSLTFDVLKIGGQANPAPSLDGLTSFNVHAVPEPSTFALAGLGAAALLIFRRRK